MDARPRPRRPLDPRRLADRTYGDAGFTLVELLVAMFVLLVGMLGVVAMVAGANAVTVATRGREGATNVQRELVERARSIPYAKLNSTSIYDELQALPGLADVSASPGYQVRRRGFTYTATFGVCSVDDPKDGLGVHGTGAFCPGGAGATDTNPDDYKVVTVDLAWAESKGKGSSRQQALINSPGNNLGPGVCGITIDGSANTVVTNTVSSLNVGVCVTFTPTTVAVTVDGEAKGSAGGSGLSWAFPWTVDALVDGNYLVGARAYDDQGRPGAQRSVTVTLNRFVPLIPTGLAAGRNGSVVEAEWLANRERDVVGYRLFRDGAAVASCSFTTQTQCQDTAPPSSPLLTYTVKALDRDPSGNLREGLTSLPVTVTTLNTQPNPPTDLTASTDSQGDTVLEWEAPDPDDPNFGDSIAFYRIYRDGTTVSDRIDRTGLGTEVTWTDARSAGESHTYYVTAVDTQLAESTPVGPVSP
jgi:prepilin-type N-terminal cleavage/methylation domain-containing protein